MKLSEQLLPVFELAHGADNAVRHLVMLTQDAKNTEARAHFAYKQAKEKQAPENYVKALQHAHESAGFATRNMERALASMDQALWQANQAAGEVSQAVASIAYATASAEHAASLKDPKPQSNN